MEQFLAWWLSDDKRGSVRPSTFDGYERKVRLHINPELGKIRLEKLTTQQGPVVREFETSERLSTSDGAVAARGPCFSHDKGP